MHPMLDPLCILESTSTIVVNTLAVGGTLNRTLTQMHVHAYTHIQTHIFMHEDDC